MEYGLQSSAICSAMCLNMTHRRLLQGCLHAHPPARQPLSALRSASTASTLGISAMVLHIDESFFGRQRSSSLALLSKELGPHAATCTRCSSLMQGELWDSGMADGGWRDGTVDVVAQWRAAHSKRCPHPHCLQHTCFCKLFRTIKPGGTYIQGTLHFPLFSLHSLERA